MILKKYIQLPNSPWFVGNHIYIALGWTYYRIYHNILHMCWNRVLFNSHELILCVISWDWSNLLSTDYTCLTKFDSRNGKVGMTIIIFFIHHHYLTKGPFAFTTVTNCASWNTLLLKISMGISQNIYKKKILKIKKKEKSTT